MTGDMRQKSVENYTYQVVFNNKNPALQTP